MSVQQISIDEFLQLRERNADLLVIDVRTAAEFSSEFLSGCEHIPLHEINEDLLTDAMVKKNVQRTLRYIYSVAQGKERLRLLSS
ncbi:MAG: rhodanese-related sulfurtransferase [Pseudohongiellaceae bacterium]|jgi:rhodanese-related sulfurtransferase